MSEYKAKKRNEVLLKKYITSNEKKKLAVPTGGKAQR